MSTSLGRFTTALLAGSQETTLALAALNFDFSLYKVEAPAEYQPLGAALSVERRTKAETGQQHVTARKLGALFRSELPRAPALSALIGAYGRRVSEIVKAPEAVHVAKDHAFTEHAGFDGTSIWAAATSGREALCMQLLACMLARFWDASEAVSIWSELIDTRKKNLQSREDPMDFSEVAGLQANLTRENLAEWDASVRAWLRTADAANSKRQTQLRLIVQNVQVDVSPKMNTYESVMEAWISAMTTVDNLVRGVAQRVQSGAALLGLTAWHLFPDLLVFGFSRKAFEEVKQNDPVIADGGILTVGLEMDSSAGRGVSWSLSLAKLRYYGEPVLVKKAMSPSDDHVRYDQFMLIVLGSLFNHWKVKKTDREQRCKFVVLVCGPRLKLIEEQPLSSLRKVVWMRDLMNACKTVLSSTGKAKAEAQRLVDFGQRRCASFLNEEVGLDVFVHDILQPRIYVACLNRTELRIAYLREIAISWTMNRSPNTELNDYRGLEWIIQYTDKSDGRVDYYYATVGLRENYRWREEASSHPEYRLGIQNSENVREELHSLDQWTINGTVSRGSIESIIFVPSSKVRRSLQEETQSSEQDKLLQCLQPQCTSHRLPMEVDATFKVYYGDVETAALFRRISSRGPAPPHIPAPRDVRMETALKAMEADHIDHSVFLKEVGEFRAVDCDCLMALQIIALVYSSLPGANVSTKITQSGIKSGMWLRGAGRRGSDWFTSPDVTRAQSFACIVRCETGDNNLDPENLSSVMAVSISDSLYLAASMLADPHEYHASSTIHRVLGNIGKPGMSLLIPPLDPMVRPLKLNEWEVVSHLDFDGQAADSFATTSLHLSLTDYRVPYAAVHEGARDIQTFFQEAVVSIYDGATWVADLDILKSVASPHGGAFRLGGLCSHTSNEKRWSVKHVPTEITQPAFIVADNWSEILDRPKDAMVVRARDNWIARLAITTLGKQLGYTVYVVPKTACAECFSDPTFLKGYVRGQNDLLVY